MKRKKGMRIRDRTVPKTGKTRTPLPRGAVPRMLPGREKALKTRKTETMIPGMRKTGTPALRIRRTEMAARTRKSRDRSRERQTADRPAGRARRGTSRETKSLVNPAQIPGPARTEAETNPMKRSQEKKARKEARTRKAARAAAARQNL